MAKSLDGLTLLVSGASRGIGLAIARRCAADGANVAILAKTDRPHPKLEGTVHTAAQAIEEAGGRAYPLVCDIRDGEAVEEAAAKAAERFGGIDIVVNNASAISLTATADTPMKRYDLMASINGRGTFAVTQACLPWLVKSPHARILTMAPPLNFAPRWFRDHAAYSLAKYAMGILTMGWAAEYEGRVAANCLWPRTLIDTAAVRNLLGGDEAAARARRPEIVADAAHAMMLRPVSFTGWYCLDDLLLAAEGATEFDGYAVTPGGELMMDLFLPEGIPDPQEAGGAVGWRAPALGEPAAPDAP